MTNLSILIPARNEIFLARTIQDILTNMRGDTEIIAVLDGAWADPPIEQHPKVNIIYHAESIGQRAATNEAARLAKGKYVMKVDAHCAFDEGFDIKMMEKMEDDITLVPVMRNLHVFNWKCLNCGMEVYQGPKPEICRNETCTFDEQKFEMNVVWIAKTNPQSSAYRFNKNLRFKYFPELRAKQSQTGLVETMSLQGSCFICTREKYWELGLCDDSWGSWGQQGTEVALKTWLSGGRVMCNRDTWYAHMFRTQPGFSHPYADPGKDQQRAIKKCQEIFLHDKWDKAVRPLSWLLDKFWFALKEVRDTEAIWTEEDLLQLREVETPFSVLDTFGPSRSPPVETSKGAVYFTDNRLDPNIMYSCQQRLLKSINGTRIISVSLQPMTFGDNIVLPLERGYLTMFKQILAGLEELKTDVVFLCEHDVLYHPSHFLFTPPKKDVYYYNTNVWKVRYDDGHALHYDCKQTSGLCAYRELLVQHYRERVRKTEAVMTTMGRHEFGNFIRKQGFEPGTHHRTERVDDYKAEAWQSEFPNIDIRHENNLTPSRWRQDQFRDQRNCRGWTEADHVDGWGVTKGRMAEILKKA